MFLRIPPISHYMLKHSRAAIHGLVMILCASTSLAAIGCQKQEEPPPTQKTEEVAAPPTLPEAPKQATSPEVGESMPETQVTDGIPTEEDYEEEAARNITAANLEAELDKLEAEIGAE